MLSYLIYLCVIWNCVSCELKKYLKLIMLCFLNYFDRLISKIIFFKIKKNILFLDIFKQKILLKVISMTFKKKTPLSSNLDMNT